MKPEAKLQIRALLKLMVVVGFAFLYAWGGMEMKWLRRYLAPAWLTTGMFCFSRNWRVFLQAPLMMGALSMGYGADTFWAKIVKRFIYGLANSSTPIPHLLSGTAKPKTFWPLFTLNAILVTATCVILGVWNPTNARTEELVMGFMIGFLSIYIPDDSPEKG